MCRAPRSTGPPKGLTLWAVFVLPVLLMQVVYTNSQELPEPANKILMMIKENTNQIARMQTSLMEIKSEIQSIKQFSNMPGTTIEQDSYENMICPEFFILKNKTGECFLIGRHQVTYKEASERCTAIGANLAIPRDYKSISFTGGRESPPIPQYLWIGLDDKLTPGDWRWIDGTPIHNSDGLEKFNQTFRLDYMGNHMTDDLPANRGFNCGFLKAISGSPGGLRNFKLDRGRCDIQEKGYLCEIKPSNVPFDLDVSPALCPVGFSVLKSTQECIHISTEEESTPYLEAEEICSSLGAKLARPMDLSILSTYLHKQNFADVPGFWLHITYLNSFPYVVESWNDTAPDILKVDESSFPSHPGSDFWLSKGYCPLMKAGSVPFDWDNGEVDGCSSSHRFICSISPF